MDTPQVVSAAEWNAARETLRVKEKALTKARDALADERRRMPWLKVGKDYVFDGPGGRAGLLDLFEGQRQLIVYRFFFEPGVEGWSDRGCIDCSTIADQVDQPAHLHERDTSLAFMSRAPQEGIARMKARMGWDYNPWYTLTDDFDAEWTSMRGTAPALSFATATRSFEPILSTDVATSKWAITGIISI